MDYDTPYGSVSSRTPPNLRMQTDWGSNSTAANQFLNPFNPMNAMMQNPFLQQQYQYDMMNQQMAQMSQEREELRRRLQQQNKEKDYLAQMSSRQRENEALVLLDDFQRSMGGGARSKDPFDSLGGPGDMRDSNPGGGYLSPGTRFRNKMNMKPPINQPPGNYYDQGGQSYQNGAAYQSPFQAAANQMISQNNPYQPPMQGADPNGGYQAWPNSAPNSRKASSNIRMAEILMMSLEKQNQILTELTSSISRERDFKVLREAKEIEHKILQLESEANQYQPSPYQSNVTPMSSNYNKPYNPLDQTRQNSLAGPGMSLPNMMSSPQMPYHGMPGGPRFQPYGTPLYNQAMFNDIMKYQMKLFKEMSKKKKKDKHKKKKTKLDNLLNLLGDDAGSDDDGNDDGDKGKQAGASPTMRNSPQIKSPTKGKASPNGDKGKPDKDKDKELRQKAAADLNYKYKEEKRSSEYKVFYKNFYDEKNKKKKEIYEALNERIRVNVDNAKTWIKKAIAKGLDMIVNPKLNIVIVGVNGKKPTPKDIETRVPEIQKILKSFMDGFVNNTKREILPSQLISFLGDISQNYCFPPQSYLFQFELMRLNFTHTVALKDMNPAKVKMICMFFLFVRVFIHEMLLQTDKVVPTVKMTDAFYRNIKTLASIMVIALIDLLKARLVIQNGNQNHLDTEIRLKPRTALPFNPPMDLKDEMGEGEEGAPQKKKDETEIVITNLYTREQLMEYFQKKPLCQYIRVEELKALIEGWCDSIAEIVTTTYQEEQKAKQNGQK